MRPECLQDSGVSKGVSTRFFVEVQPPRVGTGVQGAGCDGGEPLPAPELVDDVGIHPFLQKAFESPQCHGGRRTVVLVVVIVAAQEGGLVCWVYLAAPPCGAAALGRLCGAVKISRRSRWTRRLAERAGCPGVGLDGSPRADDAGWVLLRRGRVREQGVDRAVLFVTAGNGIEFSEFNRKRNSGHRIRIGVGRGVLVAIVRLGFGASLGLFLLLLLPVLLG